MDMRFEKGVVTALLVFCALSSVIGLVQITRKPFRADAMGDSLFSAPSPVLASMTLDGMITESNEEGDWFSSESNAMRVRRLLYEAAKDEGVKGVLLRINSPGGTVGMSQELYNAVLAVRRAKPIVVSMGDVAASGGYYTAAAADRIVADPGTLTASIGVILHAMNVEGLLTGKLGIRPLTIKSGRYKDILSPFRASRPEEVALLQQIIDHSYRQFLQAVLTGRTQGMKPSPEKTARIQAITAVADGRVVLGEDAIQTGLVDSLGGIHEATGILQTLAGKRFGIKHPENLSLEEYEGSFNLWKMLGLSAAAPFQATSRQMATPWPQTLVPTAMRYANQPLWLMETL